MSPTSDPTPPIKYSDKLEGKQNPAQSDGQIFGGILLEALLIIATVVLLGYVFASLFTGDMP